MLAPTMSTRPFFLSCANTAGQTLPEPAIALLAAVQGAATAGEVTALAVVSGAPGAGDIQSQATAQNPSAAVTLNAAPTANSLLAGAYVPRGAMPAAA